MSYSIDGLHLKGYFISSEEYVMNTKRLWLGLMIGLLIMSTLACQLAYNIGESTLPGQTVRGSGTVATQERSVSGFTEVDLSSIGNLVIEVGDQEALRIEAEENLLDYLEAEVRGRTLDIGVRRGTNLQPSKPIYYYLTVKSLDAIKVSGLGDVEAPNMQADDFSVEISGGGDINIAEVSADQLVVEISGLGSLEISDGNVREQQVNISGGGDYKAGSLNSDTAFVNISGLGSATLQVNDLLDVNISGGGSVRYYGDPSVDRNISGLGTIQKVGE